MANNIHFKEFKCTQELDTALAERDRSHLELEKSLHNIDSDLKIKSVECTRLQISNEQIKHNVICNLTTLHGLLGLCWDLKHLIILWPKRTFMIYKIQNINALNLMTQYILN